MIFDDGFVFVGEFYDFFLGFVLFFLGRFLFVGLVGFFVKLYVSFRLKIVFFSFFGFMLMVIVV